MYTTAPSQKIDPPGPSLPIASPRVVDLREWAHVDRDPTPTRGRRNEPSVVLAGPDPETLLDRKREPINDVTGREAAAPLRQPPGVGP